MTKILNDPIYGLIDIDSPLILSLMEHPIFQRLRRINQLGFTHYVYPAATHTRFSHCVGAMHLMRLTLQVLRSKKIDISQKEAEAVQIAILLHDLGHGPFSHSLEYSLIDIPHEQLSLAYMDQLNVEFGGALDMAIAIFKDTYHKRFLHQLISGQLDMDRLDYLTRDSFFTGVTDGKVGYDRIIKTLNVHNDELVVEFKGIYSVENFLIARRLMYWQVYLHKNVVCAGEMLKNLIKRIRFQILNGKKLALPEHLLYFLSEPDKNDMDSVLHHFHLIDDTDIIYALKVVSTDADFITQYLANGILERRLLRTYFRNHAIRKETIDTTREQIKIAFPDLTDEERDYLLIVGKETNQAYKKGKKEIQILLKDGKTRPISEWREHNIVQTEVIKHFACYPKM